MKNRKTVMEVYTAMLTEAKRLREKAKHTRETYPDTADEAEAISQYLYGFAADLEATPEVNPYTEEEKETLKKKPGEPIPGLRI